MPFLDKLKAVFIVPESGKTNSVTTNQVQEEPYVASQPNPTESNPESNVRFLEILAQVLEKNNQPGFDYLEFRKAVHSIAQLQHLDEMHQFKTAYAAAQSLNVNADSLIDSANKYLNILESEQIQFNKTAEQYLQNQLNQKQAVSNQLKQAIKLNEEKLAQIQSQLDADKTKLNELEGDLAAAKLKVDSNKLAFSNSYQQVVSKIQEDVQKMKNYLK